MHRLLKINNQNYTIKSYATIMSVELLSLACYTAECRS